jgi:hypothetical protein
MTWQTLCSAAALHSLLVLLCHGCELQQKQRAHAQALESWWLEVTVLVAWLCTSCSDVWMGRYAEPDRRCVVFVFCILLMLGWLLAHTGTQQQSNGIHDKVALSARMLLTPDV